MQFIDVGLMKKTLPSLIFFLFLLLLLAGCASDTSNPQQESIAEEYEEHPSSIEQEPPAESINDEHSTSDEQGLEAKNEVPLEKNQNEQELIIVIDECPNPGEQNWEDEIYGIEYEIKAIVDLNTNFTSTWAKTDKYFFFSRTHITFVYAEDGTSVRQFDSALYRLPLNDITQGDRVAVPHAGSVGIVGTCGQYLFISQRSCDMSAMANIYRIAPSTMQATYVYSNEFWGVPVFHAASNSILFAYPNDWHSTLRLGSFQLDTGIHRTIYEFGTYNHHAENMGWWQMENDAVIFVNILWVASDWGPETSLIDADLQVQRIQLDEVGRRQPVPQNPAEEFIFELGVRLGQYATIDDWVYYLSSPWGSSLYRIKVDGTQNMLVEEGSNIRWLLDINGTPVGTIFARPNYDTDWHEAVLFSQDGGISKVLGSGSDGHNWIFHIQHLPGTDMVMIINLSVFRLDGSVQALYCTATGALFSVYAQ